jgi:hypothetical protein
MRKFTITINTNAKQRFWDKQREVDRDFLEAIFSTYRDDGKKDGACFVPGTFVGNERKTNAVDKIDFLVYDVDGRQTYEELEAIMEATGVYGFIYTSFSHLTTKTEIAVDHYIRWAKKQGLPEREASEDDVIAYVADKANRKDHLKNVKCDMKIKQTENGQVFVLTHDPLPKMRVVLPLNKTIVTAELGIGTKGATAEYKSIYHGVGRALGIDFDTACEDPSRLYYFPSCKPGAETRYRCFLKEMEDPPLLDWEAYPRAAVADKTKKVNLKTGAVQKVGVGETTVLDKDGVPINLTAWEAKNYDFDIEALLQSVLDDDMLKAERAKGGYHITCPFEHEHSSTGGMGTFVANGDGDYGWTIHCMHDACVSQERRKIDYIGEWIKQGYITASDLGVTPITPTQPVASIATPETVDPLIQAARNLGLDPTTLGKRDEEHPFGTVAIYEDKPLEGDDALSKEEVYNSALADILEAKTDSDVSNAIGRIRHKECDVDISVMIECLAKSSLNGHLCCKHIRSILARTDEDIPEALKEFTLARERLRDPNDWLKSVYDSAHAGTELERDFAQMAAYYGVSAKEIKKRHQDYQEVLLSQDLQESIKNFFPDLRARYAKLKEGSSVVFIDMLKSRERSDPDIYTRAALHNLLENRNIVVPTKKGKPTRVYAFDTWCLEDRHIQEYEKITFLPRGAPEKLPSTHFNIWDENKNYGFAIPPIEGDCSMITKHILNVWCDKNEELYNWVMTWLAHIVQLPGQKPHSALTLLGPPGTGKSIIFEFGFSRILGTMYGASAAREDIAGRFSGHLVGKLMWLSEETLFAGDVRSMHLLKDRISRKEIDIEKKGVDKFPMPSYTRYIFTSNAIHALHLEPDDRRFCVLQTAVTHKQDTEYFTKMRKYLEGEGANHLLHFLLTWKPEEHGMTWEKLNAPPYTDAKGNQITQSFQDMDNFFKELVVYGQLADTPRDVFKDGTISWPLEEGYVITGNRFRNCFIDYLRYHAGSNYRFERTKFLSTFEKFFGVRTTSLEKATWINGATVRALHLPPRKDFIKAARKAKMITQEEYNLAMSNTETHIAIQSEVC